MKWSKRGWQSKRTTNGCFRYLPVTLEIELDITVCYLSSIHRAYNKILQSLSHEFINLSDHFEIWQVYYRILNRLTGLHKLYKCLLSCKGKRDRIMLWIIIPAVSTIQRISGSSKYFLQCYSCFKIFWFIGACVVIYIMRAWRLLCQI